VGVHSLVVSSDTSFTTGASRSGQVRTFLIADVRGYTRFTRDHGDEAAAALAPTSVSCIALVPSYAAYVIKEWPIELFDGARYNLVSDASTADAVEALVGVPEFVTGSPSRLLVCRLTRRHTRARPVRRDAPLCDSDHARLCGL
jgi:hypothetical protein